VHDGGVKAGGLQARADQLGVGGLNEVWTVTRLMAGRRGWSGPVFEGDGAQVGEDDDAGAGLEGALHLASTSRPIMFCAWLTTTMVPSGR